MNKQNNTAYTHKRQLHIMPRLAILTAAMYLTGYIVFSITLGSHAGVFPTTLTLKKESCDLLQQERIVVKRYPGSDNICMLMVEFRSNVFGNGGRIYLEERRLNIADNQVVATELVDEPSAIRSRSLDLVMVMVCTGFLMGTVIGLSKI